MPISPRARSHRACRCRCRKPALRCGRAHRSRGRRSARARTGCRRLPVVRGAGARHRPARRARAPAAGWRTPRAHAAVRAGLARDARWRWDPTTVGRRRRRAARRGRRDTARRFLAGGVSRWRPWQRRRSDLRQIRWRRRPPRPQHGRLRARLRRPPGRRRHRQALRWYASCQPCRSGLVAGDRILV